MEHSVMEEVKLSFLNNHKIYILYSCIHNHHGPTILVLAANLGTGFGTGLGAGLGAAGLGLGTGYGLGNGLGAALGYPAGKLGGRGESCSFALYSGYTITLAADLFPV